MKQRVLNAFFVLILAASMGSCWTLTHTVGQGAQGGTETTKRHWYALWGLIPITDADSKDMTGGETNYTIESQWTPIDILMNLFTFWVTIGSRTVTVTK